MGNSTFPRDQFKGPKGDRGPAGPRGPVGPQGPAGSGGGGGGGSATVWRSGAGAPSSGLGADGDYYLRTTNGDVYLKSSGAYSVVANIMGPAGADGADGADGANGANGINGVDGSTWYTGAGAPAGGTGVNGDLYLRTSNGDVYRKVAGVWGVIANITGPAGAAGAAGAPGADAYPGGPAPAFPAIAATIYERWIFDAPNLTLVDGRVSQVTGVVNGRTFVQATAANRPRFYPRRFNGGFGSVFFNGTSHRMTHTPAATKAIPFTIVAVIEDYLGGTGNQNLVNTGSIIWFRSGGNWVAYAGTVAQHTTSGALAVTAPLLDGGTNHPVAGIEVFNGAATVVNAYGTEQTISSGAAANALTNAVNVVLCDDGAGTGWARVKIRELIFIEGAITAPERAALLTYYSHPLIAGIPSPI